MELCDYCLDIEADIILSDKTQICNQCFENKAWKKIYKKNVKTQSN